MDSLITGFLEDKLNMFHMNQDTLQTYEMKPIAVVLLMLVVISVIQAKKKYCPKKSSAICVRASNKCCDDCDCDGDMICCQENCGNTCHKPVAKKTDGEKVKPSSTCSIDPK
ncbi:hypothetical protein NPIL_628941 [Nephila pilipes]|uniref:WAP domain-containing protein n=1 Tax=Nephila pilipes TaxID=299642 RepID=A0A8X6QMC6_NEPPI|nr:hypothetical protein NPIL_628941 [Nephila pilipes]